MLAAPRMAGTRQALTLTSNGKIVPHFCDGGGHGTDLDDEVVQLPVSKLHRKVVALRRP
jgi:hypothetical protein